MAETRLCMGCMRPLPEGATDCPHCAYPAAGVNPSDYLPVRTVLSGRYLIGRVLEIGGDSAVYIAKDQQDDSTVLVREFLPAGLCCREADGRVAPLTGKEEPFIGCCREFLQLSRAVGRLRDIPVMIPSYDIFEANGTAYRVHEYCETQTLESLVNKRGGRLSVEETRRLFLPFLKSLMTVHTAKVLHLALSPKNIVVDAEGHLRIKNFAIPDCRQAGTACKAGRVAGFAAPEQYEEGAVMTPATDIYAVAGCVYFALTGKIPPEATQRVKRGDELFFPDEVLDEAPDYLLDSIERAMQPDANERTATAEQFLDEISATSAIAALREDETEEETPAKKKKTNYIWIVFAAVLIVLAILALFVLKGLGFIGAKEEPTETTESSYTQLTLKPTTPTDNVQTGTGLYVVENMKGKLLSDLKTKAMSGQVTAELAGMEYSDTVPKGEVISQSPEADTKVPRGTVVQVVISAGPRTMKLIDLKGWNEEHARLYLEALGMTVGESLRLQLSSFEKGTVVRSDPPAGSTISVGDTVTLWVSDVEQVPDGSDVVEETSEE